MECCEGGVTGSGNPAEGVVIVGIAPGRDEWTRSRKCFTGPAGKLLDAILESVGWSRNRTYCTNMLCWYKDAPEPAELIKCRPRLDAEIAEAAPRLIIALGAIVTQALLGEKKIGRVRGVPMWSHRYNAYIMPTYHPAAVLRGQHLMIYDIQRDLAKIPSLLDHEFLAEQAPLQYHVCTSKEEAQFYLDTRPPVPLALDIETSHTTETIDPIGDEIDVFSERLLCLSISDGLLTIVIPAEFAEGLRWPDAQWTFHNGMFDTQGLRRYLDVQLPIVEDTMLQSYALDERGSHKLKDLSREYCQAGFYEDEVRGQELFKVAAHGELTEAQRSSLYEYNAKDSYYTHRLYNVLTPRLGSDRVYHELLIPAANIYAQAQYRGIAVDVHAIYDVIDKWVVTMLGLENSLQQQAADLGFPGKINLDSPKQLSKLLYGILGLEGGPSTAIGVLEELDHPFVEELLEYRKLWHIYNSYLVGIHNDIKRDGRCHPSVLLHGTVTGRRSYHDPPIQTIPQDASVGHLAAIKRLFKATDENYVLLEADYQQIEIWIGQALSGDLMMLEDLTTPFDEYGPNYHSRITENVLRVPRASDLHTWNAARLRAKKVTFGLMYMVGPKTLANRRTGIDCTIMEATNYAAMWYERNADFRRWQQEQGRLAREVGEVITPFGRKRRFPLILDDRPLRQAANFPIQSTASDYPLSSLIELHPLLEPLDCHILFDVHDSIVFEINRRNQDEAIRIIREVMEKPRYPSGPAVRVDMKAGPNWYDMEKV